MSNVTREDILKDAPDFVQIASKYMQDIYIDYEKARIKLDECPDRFLTYEFSFPVSSNSILFIF